jgi:hypothetical protein
MVGKHAALLPTAAGEPDHEALSPGTSAATPWLNGAEHELAQITAPLVEPAHRYRFTAVAACYELVQRRIDDLREEHIQGPQTVREFTERRLAETTGPRLQLASNHPVTE